MKSIRKDNFFFFRSIGRAARSLAWLEHSEEEGNGDKGRVRAGGSRGSHRECLRSSSEKCEQPLEGTEEKRDRI